MVQKIIINQKADIFTIITAIMDLTMLPMNLQNIYNVSNKTTNFTIEHGRQSTPVIWNYLQKITPIKILFYDSVDSLVAFVTVSGSPLVFLGLALS